MFIGTLFWDASDDFQAWLKTLLDKSERIVGLRETGTDDGAFKVPLHLLVTTRRNALVAFEPKAQTGVIHALPVECPTKRTTSIARAQYVVDGRERFDCSRVTSGDLDALFEIAFEPRSRMLWMAAEAHANKRRWNDADDLLIACADAIPIDAEPTAEGFMEPAQEVTLQRSILASHRGDENLAVKLLGELSKQRPDDDLVSAAERSNPPESWWLLLALAHEEAGDPASAAVVYHRLAVDSTEAEIFQLSRARTLRQAGKVDEALEAYDAFMTGRAAHDFRLVAAQIEVADDLGEAGDLGAAAALVESAEMLVEAGRGAESFPRWIDAIRAAPYRREGYDGLFELVRQMDEAERDEHAFLHRQASEVVSLVLPRLAEELAADGLLRGNSDDPPWQRGFAKLDPELHDKTLVHPGERASSSLAQKWTAALMSDERDVAAIAMHAQPADHPVVTATVEAVSAMLGIDAPRVYLSHGSNGVDVLDRNKPFILLGAAHVDPANELFLGDQGLAFAIGTQLEHIRAGHLMLTSSEFWKTFGTKSMTAVLAFVPMGDLLGKVTDGAVLKWVNKLKGTQATNVSKMAEIVEKRVSEGAGRETLQSAYAATLGKLRAVGLASAEKEQEHLVKERLADFARCARYTADRVGLLATGDLSDSVHAICALTPSFAPSVATVGEEGLAAALSELHDDGRPRYAELALRISELMTFALSDEFQQLRTETTP